MDLLAIDREFDYLVGGDLPSIEIGTIVKVPLGGRKVRGWVVADDVLPVPGIHLKPILEVVGAGPDVHLVELSKWAAWRWAGRRAHFLRTASPAKRVRISAQDYKAPFAPRNFSSRVVRLPPTSSGYAEALRLVEPAVRSGRTALVLAPTLQGVENFAQHCRHSGVPISVMPNQWGQAEKGGSVVTGARAAAWAPAPQLAGIVVLDAQSEFYGEERAPTWNAVQVAEERARRQNVPFVAMSSCPTVELLAGRRLVPGDPTFELAGWSRIEVIDMRIEDPRNGLFSSQCAAELANAKPIPGAQMVCVLNRRGRAKLLACVKCLQIARCSNCGSAMQELTDPDGSKASGNVPGWLVCPNCAAREPYMCSACGSGRLKRLRVGVNRIAEELSALTGLEVLEITGATKSRVSSENNDRGDAVAAESKQLPLAPIIVGTEAVLHRVKSCASVIFLHFDQELLAPRLGAPEHCLELLAMASRLVGGRSAQGKVVIQTRFPDDVVIAAATRGDPSVLSDSEGPRRLSLGLPPFGALAMLSGTDSSTAAARLKSSFNWDVAEMRDGQWLVRAGGHQELCDGIAWVGANPHLRVEVDPQRV